ncbi:uncharacterized protein PV09_05610 [Verruconis gallopava]|uniref:Nuclear pore complex protein n=1 Tax=Verruconis gallopava TaxID=253628 RepID=A0A0D2A9X8_9PEZI|nr:uncharacterized protein PV09_05610 [Verruconis gallopava]KIW03405.1 hypothetical protein PV09_05610 [Verruconis gallopava]
MEFSEQQLNDIQERIGYQLETLAQHVDQWLIAKSQLDKNDSNGKFQAASRLLEQIEQVAKDKKRDLALRGRRKSRLSTSTVRRLDDFSSATASKPTALRNDDFDDELKELCKWQDEINSWDLLRILSALQYSKANPEHKREHAQRYSKLHKYSADTHLWTKFLIMEDSAREKKLVLEWLERCARDDHDDIDTVLNRFDEAMGNGETSWSHGWMSTREEIKRFKRLSSQKGATPAKAVSFRSKDSSDVLVTQLDPDAPTRQGRKLQKDDENRDRVFWFVCYGMFRRGMSWESILNWCEERNEGWRAASLGAAQDLPRNESRLCLAGPYAGALWRRMCYKASQEARADQYERATYGLLAGDVMSVEPVCQSWTDWLYVNYNSLLLSSFEEWLKKHHPERFPSIVSQKYALYDSVPQLSDDMDVDGMSTTLRILGNEKFSDKARDTVYLFQGSFVAHAFDRFAANLGIAIAQVYGASETSLLKIPPHDAPVITFYQKCAQDIDMIRLAVHAFIIYKDLGFDMRPALVDHADNIILCYINYLRELRKYEAIPTYAKCLSNEDVVAKALGRLLFDITKHAEQQRMVSLIEQADLDLVAILTEQYIYALAEAGLAPREDDQTLASFPLIEHAEMQWAGWRVSKVFENDKCRRMIGDYRTLFTNLKPSEQRIVRSLQWFFSIQAPWPVAFSALATVLKQLLNSGNIFAALAVTHAISAGKMSEHLTPLYLNQSINIFHDENEDAEDSVGDVLSGREPAASTIQPEIDSEDFIYQTQVEILKKQALSAKELQDVCNAINELIGWRLMEDVTVLRANDKEMMNIVKENLHELHKCMRPLLHNFMVRPPHEIPSESARLRTQEDLDLCRIKRAYLPPILLAYIGVLTFASTIVGPETLLRTIELANLLADPTNSDLAKTLEEAGRMNDFFKSLACAQIMLIKMRQDAAAEEKKRRRGEERRGSGPAKGRSAVRKKKSALRVKKREWRGETLDLWDVTKG